ncbi:GntR family transcriptional regulator [Snodgrassella sp. CFCC 13594]|jgi:DNA-binding GntR family transcriptional regulator|uniref:GntR family transcriptional regulator n=1 Tax=Snodgrassella sp. CFCC 13594 TaxID=1775559 RepID=UPI000831707C|nr:GntR family transcriptional regulator [Snodgrassella sp. CFCC 13594]
MSLTDWFKKEHQAPSASSWLQEDKPPTEADRVYANILDAIMDRYVEPGAKLTEADLCRQFVCSRGSVRSALSLLAHDRIVTLLPNRGAFVHIPTEAETEDVFDMRLAIEAILVDKLLGMDGLPEKIAPLFAKVSAEETAFVEKRRVDWIRLSNAFHMELAKLTGNEVLVQIMRDLCLRSSLIIALFDAPAEHTCSYSDHRQLLAFLQAGDKAAVKRLMKKHLGACQQRMQQQMPGDTQAAH